MYRSIGTVGLGLAAAFLLGIFVARLVSVGFLLLGTFAGISMLFFFIWLFKDLSSLKQGVRKSTHTHDSESNHRMLFRWSPPLLFVVAILVVSWFIIPSYIQPDDPTTRIGVLDAMLKIAGGTGLALTAYFTWRNLWFTQLTLRISEEGQFTERFSRSVTHLGATSETNPEDKNLEVRLGGIYGLGRLARDSPTDRRTIMEILTAYSRRNAPTPANYTCNFRCFDEPNARPSPDVQAALRVIGQGPRAQQSDRTGYRLDLRNMDLRNADLSGLDLQSALLDGTRLCQANLTDANLHDLQVKGACLCSAYLLGNARVSDVNFADAETRNMRISKNLIYNEKTFLEGLRSS